MGRVGATMNPVYRLANSLKHRERRCAAPARRTSEGVPGEYGELAPHSRTTYSPWGTPASRYRDLCSACGAQLRWSGCSGARMPRYLRDGALGESFQGSVEEPEDFPAGESVSFLGEER